MNDTHNADTGDDSPQNNTESADPIGHLAGLDPAEAPQVAEEYAAKLAAELEAAGAPAADPVQLRADLGDSTTTEP